MNGARSVRVVPSIAIAGAATGVLTVAAALLLLVDPLRLPPPTPSSIVPLLWGSAGVIVVALTRAWAPAIAWAGAILGTTAVARAIVGAGTDSRAIGAPPTGLDLAVFAALVCPAAVAGAYATVGPGTPRSTLAAVWTALVVLTVGLAGRAVQRAIAGDQEGSLPGWLWLSVVALLALIGAIRDVRPVFARARQRIAAGEASSGVRGADAFTVLRVFLDEAVPGRDDGRAAAMETERARIAADLHAEVLPSLRWALVAAEAGGSVERLATDLRVAVDEVESLLVARRSVVLEELGLLAAIEWLAERVEDRSEVRVEIRVEADGGSAARPPRDVERAAFRVAQLALDNVVRHVGTGLVRVAVAAVADEVSLRIEDEGEGPAVDEAAALRAGRRGLADMRAAASGCGASFTVGCGTDGRGTLVTFAWPAAGAGRVA